MTRPKPFWLRWTTAPTTWVTIYPNVYTDVTAPEGYPWLLKHEEVHLRQQEAYGIYRWLWRYMTNKGFRLGQEVEAIRVELAAIPEPARSIKYEWYLEQLAGPMYRYAAATKEQAALAIAFYP